MIKNRSALNSTFALVAGIISTSFVYAAQKESPVWKEQAINFVGGVGSFTIDNATYTFTESSNIKGAFYNANFAQSSDKVIDQVIGSKLFGLSPDATLKLVKSSDKLPSGKTLTVTGGEPYNYLAVHVGKGELLFNWTPYNNSSFTLTSSLGNLSNYRAYASDGMTVGNVAPVPEPETYMMLLGGLCVVGIFARRKTKPLSSQNGFSALVS
jgi:hypothetical protein